MNNILQKSTEAEGTVLTKLQRDCLTCLTSINLDRNSTVAIMLLLKEDEEEMRDLIARILHEHLTAEEVMSEWVKDYLIRKNKTQMEV